MSANVEFNITAFDEASSVFEDVSGNAQDCFSTVTSSASEAADSVASSGSEVQSSMQGVSSACSEAAESQVSLASAGETLGDNQAFGAGGVQSNALAMNTAALSAASLVMGISNVENAEVTLDRAHVTLEKDQTAVTLAQQAYNEAVADYGSNSQQASDAAAKLKDAQDTLSVAQERVTEDQRNLNDTIMMSSLQIIPGVIGAFTSLNTLISAYPTVAGAASAASDALGTALDFLAANPIVLVVAALVAVGVGLYEAYEHCAPFRDAVNEVGAVLEGIFKVALNDVMKALEVVMVPIDAFESAVSKVASTVKPLTSIIGDLTGALKGLCFAHAAPAAEEFNSQVSKGIELSKGLTQGLDPLKQGLLGVAGSTASGSGGGAGLAQQQQQTQQELISETKNLANVMTQLTATAKKSGTLNQGIAQAMARRF